MYWFTINILVSERYNAIHDLAYKLITQNIAVII